MVPDERCRQARGDGKAGQVLELKGLSRRYGDVVALDDLSFAVREGQMFGFVGPNGAGKTTAMRIVLGVLEPDRGEVRWRGRTVDSETRRRFGYMPEERGLYPKMRVRDQLEYFARLHGLAPKAAGEAADHWIERLGVAGRANDRVEQLSLGNQQRVQLAAALVHDPEVLVLDEPFSGLDPVGVDVLAEVLAGRAAEGIPVIFSSHQLELVERLCEAVAIINKGRLVATGPVAELRAAGRDRRYQVEVAGASADWASALPGAKVVDKANGRVVLELEEGADDQRMLDAARAAGRVVHFSAVEPTLSDLFRQVVQA
jgi:ABC-2 type transport system ATP-binding protein